MITIVVTTSYGSAQQQLTTKCDYYSHYDLKKYLSEADSVYKILKRKKYHNVMIVGSRGLDAATLMFIVKEQGKNKAFYYDLIEHKKRIHQGPKLDNWVKDIINDSSFLYNAKPNTDEAGHDFSYFISLNYPRRNFTELCHSSLSTDPRHRFSRALVYFLSGFK
jgi:hypothetical protein